MLPHLYLIKSEREEVKLRAASIIFLALLQSRGNDLGPIIPAYRELSRREDALQSKFRL